MGFETPPEAETNKPVIDMGPILEKVAPIEGIFSPDEEVQKLWSVPREQRREAVSVFKDKLARQREAWALCRTNIEERIEANPDLPREEMVGIVREFASHYGFAEAQVKVAESLVDDYMEMHKRVNEVRNEYPDNIALVNRLTGMEFTTSDGSDFTVEVGPMSIEIYCSRFNAGRIHERSEDPISGFKCPGFASTSLGKSPIYYLVVVKDTQWREDIKVHEREHQKNRILKKALYGVSEVRGDVREQLNRGVRGFLRHRIGEKVLGFERDFESEVSQQYESTKDPERKAFLLTEYMRLKREPALNKAKDEITAMKKENHFPYENYNVFMRQDGDFYNYLQYLREFDKGKDDPLWQETAQKVLVDEYGQIIDNAIDAFDQLRDSGYSQSEVIAMLTDKRLAEWPKTARRLLEEQK